MPGSQKLTVDARLKTLLENNAKLRHRSLLAVLGDGARDQVMIIHHLVSKGLGERPSILWCHKKDSDVPRQSRKYLKKIEKNLKTGKNVISQENAFDLFLLATPIRYCPFSDSHRLLGNTYSMCVIQDFEGVTPNILCRVVETVAGGGAVVLLLSGMQSLRQLFTLPMDVHARLKTPSHPTINPLYNQRFVLSLAWCGSCLVLDGELQVSGELGGLRAGLREVGPTQLDQSQALQVELRDLQESLADADKPLPQLASLCRTQDQAKVLLKIIDVLTEKGSGGVVSVTAGRGRGKSATLGLAVAAAVHFGLNNIFVTSPAPDNLTTFFEFVCKGFDALEYEEEKDYEVIQSTHAEYNEAVVRINIFREYRQTIQYVEPADVGQLSQAELVVVDEAAAIPLPKVKALLGPYTVLMASTINGYEGTGRSLSLKLLQQLRKQAGPPSVATTTTTTDFSPATNQKLQELSLEESVRYSAGDPVERWLYQLLCLDAASALPQTSTCPPPHLCQLYYINREVLFSGHEESEGFLGQVMSLLVASHYRNSPDDLQLLCDAPAHHLFVLLPPVSPTLAALPTVLAVIQVCLEGDIPAQVWQGAKSRGDRPAGDLVPWTLAAQFLDSEMAKRRGVRVVRVAAHPDYQSMGYGSRAITLLRDYFKGEHLSLEDDQSPSPSALTPTTTSQGTIVPRKLSAPLLSKLSERGPEPVDYLSVSYGVTLPLLRFWQRAGFLPLYLSQVCNKVTGEHSCVMVLPLHPNPPPHSQGEGVGDGVAGCSLPSWLAQPCEEFVRRFLSLLAGPLRGLSPQLALTMLNAHSNSLSNREVSWPELRTVVSGHDLQRLEKYCQNLADRHLITDLLPTIASLFFLHRLPAVHLSQFQAGLLVGVGLQLRELEEVAQLLGLAVESGLGQFNRAMRRLLRVMVELQEKALASHLPDTASALQHFTPVTISLEDDLQQAAEDFEREAERHQPAVTSSLLGNVDKFAIKGNEATWQAALEEAGGSSHISIKSKKRPARITEEELQQELEGPSKKKKGKKGKLKMGGTDKKAAKFRKEKRR